MFFHSLPNKSVKTLKRKEKKVKLFSWLGCLCYAAPCFGVIRLAWFGVIRLKWFAGWFVFCFSRGKGTRSRGCAWVYALAPGRVCACAYVCACVRNARVCTPVCMCARGCGKNVTPHGWVWCLCIPVAKRRHCCENTTKTTPIYTQIEVTSVPKSNVFSALAPIPTPICAIRVTKGGRGRGPVGGWGYVYM